MRSNASLVGANKEAPPVDPSIRFFRDPPCSETYLANLLSLPFFCS